MILIGITYKLVLDSLSLMSYTHWVDRIANQVLERCRNEGRDDCILNGGLSVSGGLQHIGRLRGGEIILNSVIAEKLRDAGLGGVRQVLTLYTVDPGRVRISSSSSS